MKLVEIIKDEWYPVFSLWEESKRSDRTVEIPDELWERWVKLESDFEDMQLLLEQYYKAPNYDDWPESYADIVNDSF